MINDIEQMGTSVVLGVAILLNEMNWSLLFRRFCVFRYLLFSSFFLYETLRAGNPILISVLFHA